VRASANQQSAEPQAGVTSYAFPVRSAEPTSAGSAADPLTTKLVYEEEQAGYKGLCHQITHFAFCVENGVLQSPIRPLSDSIATLRSRDSVRNQLGILFAEEHVERRSTTA
jgi:hypothetical protein